MQGEAVGRLGTIQLVARRRQIQLDGRRGQFALRPAQVRVAAVRGAADRLLVLEILPRRDRTDALPFLVFVHLLQHDARRHRAAGVEIARLAVDDERVAAHARITLPELRLTRVGSSRRHAVVIQIVAGHIHRLILLQQRRQPRGVLLRAFRGRLQDALHVSDGPQFRPVERDVDARRVDRNLFVDDVRRGDPGLGAGQLHDPFVEVVPRGRRQRRQLPFFEADGMRESRDLDRAHAGLQRNIERA